jgi:hypothetical protein
MDRMLRLPDPEQEMIKAQRQGIALIHRRIREGDPPPDISVAIEQALAGKVPMW